MTIVDLVAAAPPQPTQTGLGRFTWEHLATIIAGIGAAFVAAWVAVHGYRRQQQAARRDQRAAMYAEALRAVEDYLEGPYRIRRKDGSAEQRCQISTWLSDVKSRLNYHQALMEVHAPQDVARLYDELVKAAQQDAGPQMTAAWQEPPTLADRDVPLGAAYDRTRANRARRQVVQAMRRELG